MASTSTIKLYSRTHSMKSSKTEVSQAPASPSGLPFSEWSDKEVREENWNDPELLQSESTHTQMQKDRRDSLRDSKETQRFQDRQVVHLPYSVNEYEWKPAREVFPNARLEVYINRESYPDLLSASRHLLHSEFMRSFISSVHTLIYLGNTTRFTPQYISSNFVPTFGDNPWRPWFHIYSNHLSGTHGNYPTINKIGKYIVRLFWMGTWRKIYVDDRLPVDLINNVMLPSAVQPVDPDGKLDPDEVVELWPYLLAKALLKIASLTWYEDREIVDFDILQCFTGWVPLKINTKGLPISEIWKICWAYSDHFSWIDKEPSNEGVRLGKEKLSQVIMPPRSLTRNEEIEEEVGIEEEEEKEIEEKEGTDEKEKEEVHDLSKIADKAHYLMACCNDLRDFVEEDEIPNFSPCWSHEFLIDQTRDIPLTRSVLNKDIDKWKRLRWLGWAVKNGKINEEDLRPENFHYKLVSAFGKVSESIVHKQPSIIFVDPLPPTTAEEKVKEAKKIGKEKNKKNGKDKKKEKDEKERDEEKKEKVKKEKEKVKKEKEKINKEKENVKEKEKVKREKEEEKDIHKKGKKFPRKLTKDGDAKTNNNDINVKEKTNDDKLPVSDPSFWVDHEKLSPQINLITVYFKPSKMNTKIRISDLNEGVWNSSKEKGEWTIVENLLEMRKSRNEPMYVFSESIDSKLFVINLSQTGYMNILEEEPRESLVITPETTMECDFCLAGLVKRIKYNLTKEVPTRYISVPQLKSKLVIHDRPYSYFILEEYDWQSNRLGDTVTSLSTFGTKTTTLNLGPGRKIFKLWIKSDTSYVLNIFSDDPLVVGNLETILLCMSKESQLLEDKCNDVANKFFKLIDSFGSPTFSMHLKTFCDSYKPEERLTKTESILVHDTFYQLLLELIKYCLGGEEMYALMILFMRWQCDPCPTDPADYNLCNCYDDGDLEYLKALERYVVRLQALFRGCYERRFMKYHDKSHRHYSKVENNLFNIYSEIFSINNRFNCSNLIRALLAHPDLDQIAEKYAARRDLENVLILKELSQKAKINEGEWTPICRQQFSVNSDDAIVIKIDLFGDLDEYVVRVIDNDTNDEIKRYTNNVTVNKYKPNERGYTVLCYAWSSITKISYCQLSFAAKKEIQQDKLLAPKISINFNSIYGIYIPNINNTICKYIIKLSSESALLTAHFTSSYPDAIIRFRLYDGKGKLLQEVTGKGDVIVPAFMLACRGKSRHHGLESTHLNKSRAAKRRVSTESRQDHEAHININANQGDESWPQRTESQRDYASQRKPHRPGSIHQVNSSSSTGLQPQVRDSIRKSQYPIRRRSSLRFSDTIVKIKSLKPHVLPYHTVFGANKANKKKTKKIQPEDFCMEVDVVDDSWPLNAEEWSNVANPMPDGQLSTFSSSVKEVTDRNDRMVTKSMMSLKSIRKGSVSQHRSTSFMRKTLKEQESSIALIKQIQLGLSKPYWIMHTLLSHGDTVDISKDTKREQEMKDIKSKWSESNPNRVRIGQQLRKKFLNVNLFPNPNQSLTDNCTKRSNVKDDISEYVLPPFDLTPYMIKDPRSIDDNNRRLKTSAMMEMDARREAALLDEAERNYKQKYENLKGLMYQQKVNQAIVQAWFIEARKHSAKMMSVAMMERIKVYEQLTGKVYIPEYDRGRDTDDTKSKKSRKRSRGTSS